jgi:hypothetical protein
VFVWLHAAVPAGKVWAAWLSFYASVCVQLQAWVVLVVGRVAEPGMSGGWEDGFVQLHTQVLIVVSVETVVESFAVG